MPARVAARIKIRRPQDVTFRHLWGLFCSIVDTSSGHDALTKPFSIRPLAILPDGAAVIEAGLLTDDAIDTTSRTLQRWWADRTPVSLGNQDDVAVTHPPHVAYVPWADLWANRADDRRLTLRFMSPLVFLHGKQGQSPWPFLPSLLKGWARKWAAFAPDDCGPTVQDLDINALATERAKVHHFDGHTAEVLHAERFGVRWIDRRYIGYLGTVAYDLAAVPARQRRSIHALASLSPYCGSGGRATIGLGVTEYVTPEQTVL